MREPTPPENVCLLDKDTDKSIPLDGIYMGRDMSGVHVWQYASPVPFDPDRHTLTADRLPPRTAIRLMLARGMSGGG